MWWPCVWKVWRYVWGEEQPWLLPLLVHQCHILSLELLTLFFWLFLSRLPSVFMHAMQGGQMIVTDLGEEGQRADALGKLGLSYGVGMVIGPFLGGLVTKFFSEQTAAFVACIGSVLSIGVVWVFVPQRTKKSQGKESSGSAVFSLKKILALVTAPGAGFLLFIRMLAGLPIGVFQSMFSVFAMETFKLQLNKMDIYCHMLGF